MKIFHVRDGVVTPTDEILLIYPFQDIWERDITPKKDIAMREFAFIEFMVSPKETNPFYGYDLPSGIRKAKIIENKFKDYPTWYPDNVVNVAMDIYREFYYNASPTLSFYDSAVKGANKLRDFFDTFSMREVNLKTGNPMYKPREISTALLDADAVMAKLNASFERVQQELFDTSKTKGNKVINDFER